MPTNLLAKITIFQHKSDNFMDILPCFNSKINYLSYKLKYPEASTDLIIYLYELVLRLDLNKFTIDDEILKYIRKCLHNKSIKLSHIINFDKNFILFNSDEEILDLIDKNNSSNEYSNIIFNDLISSLRTKQKQIIFYKFYLQLTDIEIARIFNISRQSINKTQRLALKILKANLLTQESDYV